MLDLLERPSYRGATLPNCERQPFQEDEELEVDVIVTRQQRRCIQSVFGRRATQGRGES